ncbi:MAG: hypothetical protein JST10_02975 [Bacteroidetes bacterium]|nr:hypothetical protein [Bacteroidota bacterium]
MKKLLLVKKYFLHKRNFSLSLILLPLICFTQITRPGVNSVVQPTITILHTEPEQPIEGNPVLIYFRFTNNDIQGRSLTGWIGADINSGIGAPGISVADWAVIDLPKKHYIDGAISVQAPVAGTDKKIRVFFYETKNTVNGSLTKSSPLYIGERSINIGALISFKLDTFIVRHTRARTADTDWGSLYVSLNDQPAMKPSSFFLGNFENGTFDFNPHLRSSILTISKERFESDPIIVIPGNNSILRIAYFVYNGGSIANSNEFLKGFAEATANPALFKGARPGRKAWFDALRVLCPMLNIAGACDGFVVGDSMMIQTNDLFNNTLFGNARFSRRFNSEEFASQIGCGNTSDYEVLSSTKRLSSANDAYNNFSQVYPSVTASQKLNTVSAKEYKTPISWKTLETIDAMGNFIPANDPSYGYMTGNIYNAPAEITKPLLVILRGTRTSYMINGNAYNVFSNISLNKVTAIIQLIPGPKKLNPNMINKYKTRAGTGSR